MENKPGLRGGGGVGRQKEGESSVRSSGVKFTETRSGAMYAEKGRGRGEQHGCESHLTFRPAGGRWVS